MGSFVFFYIDELVLISTFFYLVEDNDSEDEDDQPAAKRQKANGKRSGDDNDNDEDDSDEDDVSPLNVDFIFCDSDEKYFHGLKMHLHSNPVLAPHSSALADLVIENISVGTIIGTEGDPDDNVFGFASVLNVTTYQEHSCIQALKKMCLDNCPSERKLELETVLSGKTKRPAGFMLHSRMVNIPLEITEVLHDQLVQDMDWAVENAEGGDEERKSLDFGVFVLLAPCTKADGSLLHKFFDDEIFADRSELSFSFAAPKTFGSEEEQFCQVIVLTKTGHREAMKDLKKMIGQ